MSDSATKTWILIHAFTSGMIQESLGVEATVQFRKRSQASVFQDANLPGCETNSPVP